MTNFDQIPQEKFDALGNSIVNIDLGNRVDIKQVKKLKVSYIDIQDFKNISAISTPLSDWNIIGGFNGEGKSSFVEAILTAIWGNKFYGKGKVPPASLVKSGEKKSVIKLQALGDDMELIIERIFKKTGTELEATINGNKISQADLDTLLSALTIDPMKLGEGSAKDQLDTIKSIINLDTTQIDSDIEKTQEEYKEVNSFQKQAQAVYDDFILEGVPQKVEKKSLQELMVKKEAFNNLKMKKEEYGHQLNKVESIKRSIEALQEQLRVEEPLLEKIKQEGIAMKENIVGTEEEINKEISEIEQNNEASERYNKYLHLKNHVVNTSKDFEKVKEKLENLRDDRRKAINESGLPEYIELTDEGIFIEGIKYDLLNTAKKIEVAIDLVLLSGSPLRLIRIENGGEFDTKTLEKIKQKIIDHDFQIFLERPVIDEYDSIVIEDGSIIS